MKNLLKFQGRIGLNAAYVLIACAVFLFAVFAPLVAEADNPPLFTKQYDRTTGKPNLYADKFKSCNTGATYKLVVENGDATGKKRISSGSITLNGNEVVKESDFNQKTGRIEKNVSLAEANTLDVKLASAPAGLIKASIFCTANCLEVKIIEPKNGDSRISTFLLKGELYNAQGTVGIKVNADNGHGREELVYRSGNQFGAMMSMPSKSDNTGYVDEATFIAIATDACGFKSMDSVRVAYMKDTTNSQPGHLSTNPEFAVISKKTGVARVEIGSATAKGVRYYEWDFEGDGVIDKAGTGLVGLYHEYTQPGFYTPTRIDPLPDMPGRGVVVVVTEGELDAEIKPVWNGMRNALANNDVEGAMEYFFPYMADDYKKIFVALKEKGKLQEIGTNMGDIDFLEAFDDTATYLASKKRMVNGKMENVTFEVRFRRNSAGLWKVRDY